MAEQFPSMTKLDHRSFCETEGWVEVRGATGKRVKHHLTYQFNLWDGGTLRTHISNPINKVSYGKKIASKILKVDLRVSTSVFWQCVKHKVMRDRGTPKRDKSQAMPIYLYRELQKLGVTATEFEGMNEEKARKLIAKLTATEAKHRQ